MNSFLAPLPAIWKKYTGSLEDMFRARQDDMN